MVMSGADREAKRRMKQQLEEARLRRYVIQLESKLIEHGIALPSRDEPIAGVLASRDVNSADNSPSRDGVLRPEDLSPEDDERLNQQWRRLTYGLGGVIDSQERHISALQGFLTWVTDEALPPILAGLKTEAPGNRMVASAVRALEEVSAIWRKG